MLARERILTRVDLACFGKRARAARRARRARRARKARKARKAKVLPRQNMRVRSTAGASTVSDRLEASLAKLATVAEARIAFAVPMTFRQLAYFRSD